MFSFFCISFNLYYWFQNLNINDSHATQNMYKPRIVDGEAIEVAGVRNKFTYEIEK